MIKTKKYKLYKGDCLKILDKIKPNSIDLVVTSPPYDNLRSYEHTCEWNFSIFKEIAKKLYVVLKDNGVIVWVVGDATINASETGSSFKQALYFKKIGFNLYDTMVYQKQNPIPQTHKRYEQSFEYMFVLSKGIPKTFNPILVPSRYAGTSHWGNTKVLDKKQCMCCNKKAVVKEMKIKSNIWNYFIGGGDTEHPAVFPDQLAKDHIISWSNKNDIVLDPFMGSGTTGIECMNLQRRFIGIEKVKKYFEVSYKRIQKASNTLANLTWLEEK